jgi:putative Mg2+ transporter-C (MgtC) family protein
MEYPLHELSYYTDIIIRVTLSLILGFAIGLERELTSKFACLRTHILVCLGSCFFTILSIFVFPTFAADGDPQAYGDPARIAAQILTGIGFIGGGTVLRQGPTVFGLTTAATLWTTASIGMAVGTGSIILGIIATILTLVVLILVRKIEIVFVKNISQKTVNIHATLTVSPENAGKVIQDISEKFQRISELNHAKSDKHECKDKISFTIKEISTAPVLDMYKKINEIENIEDVYVSSVNFER